MKVKKVGVGVIGCGTISDTYLANLTKHFDNLEVLACADLYPEKAEATRERYNLPRACSVEELLAMPEIAVVANLTIPAVHHSVNMQCLRAGKSVYCEKPLALSLAEADEQVALAKEKGLLLAAAPDTFLGSGVQNARKLIDEGALGKLVTFTANMGSPGVELWHPAPDFYFKKGAGPVWDMGPYYLTALVVLMGPIKRVSCFSSSPRTEREAYGRMLPIEVNTHYSGIVEFQSGVVGNVNMSWEAWHTELPTIEIHGTSGSMSVPDPNMFNGAVTYIDGKKADAAVRAVEGTHIDRLMTLIRSTHEMYAAVPSAFPEEEQPRSNMRGLGISEMCAAIATGRSCRLTAELARHVVEALYAFDASASEGKPYVMTTTCGRPEPMPQNAALWQVD